MIFVTVGTHEQQFNRLIKEVDRLVADGSIQEKVMIQTGYSDYEPQNCEWSAFLSYQDMCKYVKEARIVITHGGPSSFIAALQEHKIPIVVPRNHKYGEHVNDHQLNFVRVVAKEQKNIIMVDDISELRHAIVDYDEIISSGVDTLVSNNKNFIKGFAEIVEDLMKQ